MDFKDFKNKKILILGCSITGVAAAKFLSLRGAKCFVSEFAPLKDLKGEHAAELMELEKLGVQIEFGGHSVEFIESVNICVTSPSIPPTAPVLKTLKEKNIEVISDIELAYRCGANLISVTGTNGKTTTTMLLSHILDAPACGNIGVSPLDYINDSAAHKWLVCETSSFQAHYSPTFAPKIAIFTNLTPDHIYFHGSEAQYFSSKAKIFKNMGADDVAILNLDDPLVAGLGRELKCKVYYFSTTKTADATVKNGALYFENEKIIDIKDVPIVGVHNLQNTLAAIVAAKIAGAATTQIAQRIKSFKAPEHRCELVSRARSEFGGIKFYNDSKATNPEATIVALNAFEGKNVVLIAGGRDKNTTLEEFSKVVKNTMASVVLIGEAADRFEAELKKSGYSSIIRAKTMFEAVDLAVAQKPDVVLLSPACASFDMFKSFEDRGEQFKKYVSQKGT